MSVRINLGCGHTLRFVEWEPDPILNPEYADLPPETYHHGALVGHPRPDNGRYCEGMITFDTPRARRSSAVHFWEVISKSPLTLTPSLWCKVEKNTEGFDIGCGDHGFIRDGKWVPA